MKSKIILISAFLVATISCLNNPESAKDISNQNNNKGNFDLEAATKIVEQRSKEFEDALKMGDSLAVGDIYTLDTKIIGAYSGRENIVKEVYEMTRDSITGIKFSIINLWGNDNIIVEDAHVTFFHSDGTSVSKGECLLIWKKENDTWRIFRDVFKPEK